MGSVPNTVEREKEKLTPSTQRDCEVNGEDFQEGGRRPLWPPFTLC